MRNLEFPGRSPVLSARGMAATSHPLATQAAIDLLKQGGILIPWCRSMALAARLRRQLQTGI